MKKFILSLIAVLVILGGIGYYFFEKQSNTKSSKEYAVAGKTAWNSFECSVWADELGNIAEKNRLVSAGYDLGREYLRAFKANKIAQEDINHEIPSVMNLLLDGPNEDFILGRIYSKAEELLGPELNLKISGGYNTPEMKKNIALNNYEQNNCQQIGK